VSFKMGAAFIDVTAEDNTKEARQSIGSSMMKWAGGLAIGATISKGITDNLDIGAATAKLSGQLNLTKEVSANAGKLAGEVYRDGFGQSIPEVTAAISTVGTSLLNLNTASDDMVKSVTAGVMGLASTFDQDLNEVVRATSALVANRLAPDAVGAMDLITRAFQTGGNQAGDLLSVITEYAPYFRQLGLDGPTALGLLSSGMQAGARDADYVADAFKEFGIRAIDGSKAAADGYALIGLNAEQMTAKVAAGGAGAQEGLLQVLRGLQNLKDPVAQNIAGTALFGTQWEDTLRNILPNMDLTETALTDVTGATDKMNDAAADSAKNGLEAVKRQMEGWVTSMTNMNGPLGDVSSWMLGFGGEALPVLANMGMIVTGFNSMGWASVGSAAKVVGSWIAMAAASVANAIVMAGAWLLAFWPIVLIVAAIVALVALVIMNWDTIKNVTVSVWNAVWKFVSDRITDVVNAVKTGVRWIGDAWEWLSNLPRKAAEWFIGVKNAGVSKLMDFVNWLKGLPGRILGALGDLGNLLVNIGKKIIDGLLRGLKNAWEGVKNFVSGIGNWIADHKGPIEVDAVLLVPHGNSIMSGLRKGLAAGFDTEVRPEIAGMASDIADTTITAPLVNPRSIPTVGGDGAALPEGPGAGGDTINIANLTVTFPGSLNAMSKTELRETAEKLRDLIRDVDRSQGSVHA
jgi:phage-related minor tail protein